jgi:xanthine dehydrogenase accessory factor
LAEFLAAGERLALCIILRLVGSGPRRAGATMLLREGGGTVGTIGGGALEAKVTAWAREVLRTGGAVCRTFVLDLTQASDEGMTCGGEVEVLVECLDGTTPAVRDFFALVFKLVTSGEGGRLLTALRQEGDGVMTERMLVVKGRLVASLPTSGRSVPEDLLNAPIAQTGSLIERGAVRYFLEPLVTPITVFVFGGGHIALHLVPLCARLGFRSVVVDDRADFACRDRFPDSSDLVVTPSFDHALEGLPIGQDSFLVIATRGHAGDQAILRQALRLQPSYIGMIGSQRKRTLIFEELAREGFNPDDLARVVSPIGLPIGAESPEEIAISIVAQLVATRAGRRGKT